MKMKYIRMRCWTSTTQTTEQPSNSCRPDVIKYQYVELAGFYWSAEESTHTHEVLDPVAAHL